MHCSTPVCRRRCQTASRPKQRAGCRACVETWTHDRWKGHSANVMLSSCSVGDPLSIWWVTSSILRHIVAQMQPGKPQEIYIVLYDFINFHMKFITVIFITLLILEWQVTAQGVLQGPTSQLLFCSSSSAGTWPIACYPTSPWVTRALKRNLPMLPWSQTIVWHW